MGPGPGRVTFANTGPRDEPHLGRNAVRLYLVSTDAAAQVRSRFESRLSFVGSVVPGKNGRGLLTFSVPPLDPRTYTIAYWCPGCATYSRGRTFFVQQPDEFAPRYRSRALLSLAATQSCPVTLPNGDRPPGQPRNVPWYGNGLLWAGVKPDGIYAVPQDCVTPDGSIGDKLLWVTTRPGNPRRSRASASMQLHRRCKSSAQTKARSPTQPIHHL